MRKELPICPVETFAPTEKPKTAAIMVYVAIFLVAISSILYYKLKAEPDKIAAEMILLVDEAYEDEELDAVVKEIYYNSFLQKCFIYLDLVGPEQTSPTSLLVDLEYEIIYYKTVNDLFGFMEELSETRSDKEGLEKSRKAGAQYGYDPAVEQKIQQGDKSWRKIYERE